MIILKIIKNKKYKCSITIETTISFIIMIFVLFMSLGPLFMCKKSADIITNLDKITKDYSYIKTIEEDNNLKDIKRLINNKIYNSDVDIELNNRKESIANLLNVTLVSSMLGRGNNDKNNPFCNIDRIFPMNAIEPEVNNDTIIYDYLITFKEPLNILNISDINQRYLLYRRPFIGSDGNRQLNFISSTSEANYYTAEDYKKTKIYHIYRDCYYLEKKVYEKEYLDVKDIYTPCAFCVNKISNYEGMILYTTDTGNSFHTKEKCPSMTAIVTNRNKKFIDDNGLRLCSACERKKGIGGN